MSQNPDYPNIYIVTACFNSEKTIADTLRSVASQTPPTARYFIIDGRSTDKTLKVVESHAHAFGDALVVASEPDSGIYNAMNKGIKAALAQACPNDLIGMINSDDAYEVGAFERVAQQAIMFKDCQLFYGDCILVNEDGELAGSTRRSVPVLTRSVAFDDMPIEHPAMFVRASVYTQLGLYDESYRIAADFEFVLRMLDAGISSQYIAEPLVRFRLGGVSTSFEVASYKEAIRARIAHGSSPLFEWTRYYKRRAFGWLYQKTSSLAIVRTIYDRFGRGNTKI